MRRPRFKSIKQEEHRVAEDEGRALIKSGETELRCESGRHEVIAHVALLVHSSAGKQ